MLSSAEKVLLLNGSQRAMMPADTTRTVLASCALLWGKCHPTDTEWMDITSPLRWALSSTKSSG
jgi:hypothetical protein